MIGALLGIALAVSSSGAAAPTAAPEWTPHPYPTAVPTSAPAAASTMSEATFDPNAPNATVHLIGGERHFRKRDWGVLRTHQTGGVEVSGGPNATAHLVGFLSYSVRNYTDDSDGAEFTANARTLAYGVGIRAAPRVGFLRPSIEGGFESLQTRMTFNYEDPDVAFDFDDDVTSSGAWFGAGLAVSDPGSGFEVGVVIRQSTAQGKILGDRRPMGGSSVLVQLGWTGSPADVK